ncbi:hypothetical protein BC828DRAFT_373782 [Blastocladiella britannica]|nr:hypothetical protein BC828DRAFT_373782 [Blastocladiella britannica]
MTSSTTTPATIAPSTTTGYVIQPQSDGRVAISAIDGSLTLTARPQDVPESVVDAIARLLGRSSLVAAPATEPPAATEVQLAAAGSVAAALADLTREVRAAIASVRDAATATAAGEDDATTANGPAEDHASATTSTTGPVQEADDGVQGATTEAGPTPTTTGPTHRDQRRDQRRHHHHSSAGPRPRGTRYGPSNGLVGAVRSDPSIPPFVRGPLSGILQLVADIGTAAAAASAAAAADVRASEIPGAFGGFTAAAASAPAGTSGAGGDGETAQQPAAAAADQPTTTPSVGRRQPRFVVDLNGSRVECGSLGALAHEVLASYLSSHAPPPPSVPTPTEPAVAEPTPAAATTPQVHRDAEEKDQDGREFPDPPECLP